MKNKMRISFIALVVTPVLAHKHALLEWIGGKFIWDSKTEPYLATQVNQIDPKFGPTVFLPEKPKAVNAKQPAATLINRLSKKSHQPSKPTVKILLRDEKRTAKNLLYVLSRLFKN